MGTLLAHVTPSSKSHEILSIVFIVHHLGSQNKLGAGCPSGRFLLHLVKSNEENCYLWILGTQITSDRWMILAVCQSGQSQGEWNTQSCYMSALTWLSRKLTAFQERGTNDYYYCLIKKIPGVPGLRDVLTAITLKRCYGSKHTTKLDELTE